QRLRRRRAVRVLGGLGGPSYHRGYHAATVAASSTALRARRRASARSRRWTRAGVLVLLGGGLLVGLGLIFAGSPAKLADGTRVAGVDLGGLTPAQATRLLERRSARLATRPVTFTAAGRRFRLTPSQLGVRVDWGKAVRNAERHGGGFGLIRGYRRLVLQLFPSDLLPPVKAYEPGVRYEVGLLARAIDSGHREARLVRRGLHVTIAPGATGRVLDRKAAHDVIVGALASFSRAPVALPVRTDPPKVTVDSLADSQRLASHVIDAPVTVLAGPTRLRIPRWRLAKILDLRTVSFGGPAATAYFARLARHLGHPPRDARFAVNANGTVRVVPA